MAWPGPDAWAAATQQLAALAIGLVRRAKTRAPRLLEHPLRQRIVDHLSARPGLNLKELRQDLQANRGTITHHLKLLEECGIIRSMRLGREHHFFAGPPADDEPRLALLRNRDRQPVIEAILQEPGIMQKDLKARTGASRRGLRDKLRSLDEADLVVGRRESRRRRYYPTEALRALWHMLQGKRGSPP